MKNRLEVARKFLRDDGAIFIQCDDNEQACPKVLATRYMGGKTSWLALYGERLKKMLRLAAQ